MSGLATESEDLKAHLQRVEAELAFFMELGRKLTATLDDRKVLEIIAEGAHDYIQPSHTTLYVTGRDRRTYELGAAWGYAPEAGDRPVSILEGCSGQVLRTARRLHLSGADIAERTPPPPDLKTGEPLADLICIPIVHRRRALAALLITQNEAAGPFTESHLKKLDRLMEQSGMAVDRALLYKRTADLAITDDLTQLFNHRYIDQSLDVQLRRFTEVDGGELGLIFMDLDRFKAINDTHGHLAGSHALTEVAHVLTDNLRTGDIIARYGGDEFVVILPDTSLKVAHAIARRVARSVAATTFLPQLGGMRLTASFGVAAYPEHGTTPRQMVQSADKAMYAAKALGGNQAVVYDANL